MCLNLCILSLGRLKGLRQHGLQSIAMTSNGLALHRKLPSLVENGLTHLNLRYVLYILEIGPHLIIHNSLDTLDPLKFEIMTRRMGHEAVLRALDTALSTPGLKSVKLNVVVIRGMNDSEVPKFIELTQ